MVDATELWDAAVSLDDYVGQMWRKNRKTFTRNRERTAIDPAIHERFAQEPFRILVLTEHYCEDSLQLVPMLWHLSDGVADLEVRILRQHEHPDLAAHYLTLGGYPAIPVFIVLDADLEERFALIERPARMTAELMWEIRRFQQAHPELPGINRTLDHMPAETRAALKAHIAAWSEGQHERWSTYLFEDLLAPLQQGGER